MSPDVKDRLSRLAAARGSDVERLAREAAGLVVSATSTALMFTVSISTGDQVDIFVSLYNESDPVDERLSPCKTIDSSGARKGIKGKSGEKPARSRHCQEFISASGKPLG